MPLHILDHPLASHIMTHLRDASTKPATFRTLAYQLSLLLAIEATSDLPTEEKTIKTPLESMTGRVLTHQPLVVVPILRAGLGMVQPFLDTFPDVSVGYLGLERDHETAVARNYYCKLPPLAGRRVFLVDPMLADGRKCGTGDHGGETARSRKSAARVYRCGARRRGRSRKATSGHDDPRRCARSRTQREEVYSTRVRAISATGLYGT